MTSKSCFGTVLKTVVDCLEQSYDQNRKTPACVTSECKTLSHQPYMKQSVTFLGNVT